MKMNVDISGFKQVVQGLQKITGKSFKEVLEAEAGHILSSAITRVPKATAKKVVQRTMPQGYGYRKAVGERKVTYEKGNLYHVGRPIKAGKGSRGGQRYKFPKAQWMGRKGQNNGEWERWIAQQKKKTDERILKRGLTASQFYWMGVLLNLKFPKQPPKYIKNPRHAQKVMKFLNPRKGGRGSMYEILLQSKGFKMNRKLVVQPRLIAATKARETLFKRSVKKEFIKDIKNYMPKYYPLLFR